jgi:hypothetical protein
MNRLRIVVEEDGPDSYRTIYCGTDAGQADQALRSPTTARRALFIKPSVSAYNRPLLVQAQAEPAAAPVVEPPQEPKKKKK